MPYCQNCGEEISEKAKFCPNCGGRVEISLVHLAENKKSGVVCFERFSGLTSYRDIKANIFIDGEIYTCLLEGEKAELSVGYGAHTAKISVEDGRSLLINFEIGENTEKIYYPFHIAVGGKPIFDDNVTDIGLPQEQNYQPKPKTKGLTVLCLLAIAILFVTIISTSLRSDGGSKDSESVMNAKKTQVLKSTPQPTETPQIYTPSFVPVTGSVGNWEITVNDFNYSDDISAGLLLEYQSEDNSEYCVVNITVKNCDKEAQTFLPYFSYDDDATAKLMWNGYEYTRSNLLLTDDDLSSESLNPLVSTSGDIVFEFPKEAIQSDIAPTLIIRTGNSTFECELVKK